MVKEISLTWDEQGGLFARGGALSCFFSQKVQVVGPQILLSRV